MPLPPDVRRRRRAKEIAPVYRFCKNCPTKFLKNPNREDHWFCSDPCRKQWHKNGGSAYRQILERVEQVIADKLPAAIAAALTQTQNDIVTAHLKLNALILSAEAIHRRARRMLTEAKTVASNIGGNKLAARKKAKERASRKP